MRAHSAEALILRTYRYGEADRIVVFLTEDRGKRRGVAKNATASRRRFGAALEPMTVGRVTYVERETRELVRVDRIEPRSTPLQTAGDGRPPVDAEALGYASYFAELLDEWAPDAAPNERLYRLGASVAAALAAARSVDALARYFEYWLLRLEGVYPALDRCPRCGATTMAGGVSFVAADRAYVCGGCSSGPPQLSSDAMAFLRHTVRQAPAVAGGAVVAAPVLREIERAHARLIALHLEREPRSARVVKELKPQS